MDLGIEGRVALVLGGTQGLALSAARHLSDAGAAVVLNGRDADKGSKAVVDFSSRVTGVASRTAAIDAVPLSRKAVSNNPSEPPLSAARAFGTRSSRMRASLIF